MLRYVGSWYEHMARRSRRVPSERGCRVRVRLINRENETSDGHTPSPGGLWSARVLNVSKDAINLITNRPVETGASLRLELPAIAEGPGTRVLACVVRATRTPKGRWIAECWLPLPLYDADLECLGVQLMEGPDGDRRAWPRWPCRGKAFFRPAGSADASQETAKITDLSFGGLRLTIATDPLELGTSVQLGLVRTAPMPPLEILSSLCHVRRQPGGGWSIGCTFIRELSWQELVSVLTDPGRHSKHGKPILEEIASPVR
jgi:hypothetical protein